MRTVRVLLVLVGVSAFAWSAPQKPKQPKQPKPPKMAKIAPPSPHAATTRAEFRRTHPCPVTGRAAGPCSGYVVDYIRPVACGGPDVPENMQWVTAAEAKATKRRGCR